MRPLPLLILLNMTIHGIAVSIASICNNILFWNHAFPYPAIDVFFCICVPPPLNHVPLSTTFPSPQRLSKLMAESRAGLSLTPHYLLRIAHTPFIPSLWRALFCLAPFWFTTDTIISAPKAAAAVPFQAAAALAHSHPTPPSCAFFMESLVNLM
jgi:hypothetical protein